MRTTNVEALDEMAARKPVSPREQRKATPPLVTTLLVESATARPGSPSTTKAINCN